MAETINSVERLHRLLHQAKSLSGKTCRETIAHVLNVSSEDLLAFFHGFQQILKLVYDAQQIMKKIVESQGYDAQKFLSPYPQIMATLQTITANLDRRWDEHKHSITEVQLTTLLLSVDLIPKVDSEEVIEEDELAKILSEIDELTEEIIGTGLEANLKSMLVNHLEEMRMAVNDYRIRGAVRLSEVGVSGIGTAIVVAHQITINESKGMEVDDKTKSVLSKFWSLVVKAASKAEKLKPILELVSKYGTLLLGSGDQK